MTDPVDLELARLGSRADQLRSEVRGALLEMDRAERIELFRVCARGDLAAIGDRLSALVAWMALVASFSLFEPDLDLS